MKRKLLSCLLFSALTFGFLITANEAAASDNRRSFAEVTGVVRDSTGAAITGASVTVKNTTRGTVTDSAGRFAISANPGEVLVVSGSGFPAVEVPVTTSTNYEVTLSANRTVLAEVVVSALGIERRSKSITYAQQTVSGGELNRVKDPNLMNSLAGKAAGVVISKGNAGPGASSRVILRGNKSISGNNQPLYVIDGVPMNVNANGAQGNSLSSFNGER